jgi:DNA-binding SARP family transcriptional activator
MQMGQLPEAIASLERAAHFWRNPPTSPFADNSDLVLALLASGQPDRARVVANDAIRRTEPWPRPLAHARYGLAAVHAFDGRFDAALAELNEARASGGVTGGMHGIIAARLIEAMYLADRPRADIHPAAEELDAPPQDKRYRPESVAARAIAIHLNDGCHGACFDELNALEEASSRGEALTVLLARVKVGAVALDHANRRIVTRSWDAVREAVQAGLGPAMRWWLRRYAMSKTAKQMVKTPDGAALIAQLSDIDPEGWRGPLVDLLRFASQPSRRALLEAAVRHANRETTDSLRLIPGPDVANARRKLQFLQATRLFVRTFGNVAIHRSSWNGPEIRIDKKRVRALLGLLAASSRQPLSRDAAIDLLWPDADGDSAINSLNQTVFQLRRYLDPTYRGGESPEYVISTADQIALNDELIHTDISEIHRLPERLSSADWQHRHVAVSRVLDLVRGEFLADLRYEGWASRLQLATHTDVRRFLLPIAQSGPDAYQTDVAIRAAATLLELDPYDEAAVLAMASAVAESGKRIAARDMIVSYVERLRAEFSDEPSSAFVEAAGRLGAADRIKGVLTQIGESPSRA